MVQWDDTKVQWDDTKYNGMIQWDSLNHHMNEYLVNQNEWIDLWIYDRFVSVSIYNKCDKIQAKEFWSLI